MKINLTQPIIGRNNEPMRDAAQTPVGEEKVFPILTLREVCIYSLLGMDPKETLTSRERYDRGKLIDTLDLHDEVDLSAEQITMLKELVGKYMSGNLVITRTWDLLDPPAD